MTRTARWSGTQIRLLPGDLTSVAADAIVNAANAALQGGGGVDGAIHAAGGPSIMWDLRASYPTGTPTGTAVVTGAGMLPARWVIHAVGPRWAGGGHGEPQQLASAYASALDRAREIGARTVAFPAISCGIYGYPLADAANVALQSVRTWLTAHPGLLASVEFVLRDAQVMRAFEGALAEQSGT
jgi:O-acetyl-ADP-ribose deacetylase (regulator of RNase III)